MSVNLLEMIQGQIGSAVMEKASSFLGESPSNTTKAMGAALPAILGSVIQKGSSTDGASGLMSMLSSGNHDGSIFSNLGSLLGGGDTTSGFLKGGSSILTSLLGDKVGSIVNLISSFSGIGKNSSSSLLSMAAPMVMGMLGKHVKENSLNASGLMNFLGSQSDFVKAAAPAGLSSIMGLANLGGNIKDMGSKVMDTAAATADAGSSGMSSILKWGLPLLLLVAAVYFFSNRGGTDAVTDAVSTAVDAAGDAASTVADAAGDAAGAVADAAGDAASTVADAATDAAGSISDAAKAAAAKALEGVNFVAGSVGDQFAKFMASGAEGDQTFKFNNLTFDTGSATISEGSLTEVDNLAAALKAYPTINIQIDGHTDNVGDAAKNKTLSQERADAVKARLVEQGIDASRISTMGYGDAHAIADNDTEEGKSQNRRIEVKIVK